MTEEKKEPAAKPDTVETFTRPNVIKYLSSIGVCGVVDSYALANALGTISSRMVRNYTARGKIKPIDMTDTHYVYRIEDVADFIMQNPRYLIQKKYESLEMSVERYEELTKHIKNAINSSWRPLLEYESMDDLVSEVIYRILNMRHINAPDGTVIWRVLAGIWKKKRKTVKTVNVQNIEKMEDNENEDD